MRRNETNQTTAVEGALRRAAERRRSGASKRAGAQAAARAADRLARRIAQEGLADISYTSAESPFGRLLLAATRRGLVQVAFPEQDEDAMLERLARGVSPRIVAAAAPLDRVRRELDEYFGGRRREFDLPLDWALVGPFGRRVLGVTAQIPYGGVLSYAEVAADAGSPRAQRAAGNALGANPMPIVIPCHRVVRSGGAIGNYGGGPERKRWLLELEGAIPARA
jgi:methylated-DNA-[protein]-cysteine S-methyltransferase